MILEWIFRLSYINLSTTHLTFLLAPAASHLKIFCRNNEFLKSAEVRRKIQKIYAIIRNLHLRIYILRTGSEDTWKT